MSSKQFLTRRLHVVYHVFMYLPLLSKWRAAAVVQDLEKSEQVYDRICSA